jgi:transcriptional regulator with AAA-type ATPase domain
MTSEASAQLNSLRSRLMAEFYSRAFDWPWEAKTKTEFQHGFDRRDAVAGFRINRSDGQDDRDHQFDQIIGKSPALEAVLELVERVAPTTSTVLIQGETGTGKELIAKAVHNISPPYDRPFVKVNCAAIPLDLLESELFGHERGALIGAIAQKSGVSNSPTREHSSWMRLVISLEQRIILTRQIKEENDANTAS